MPVPPECGHGHARVAGGDTADTSPLRLGADGALFSRFSLSRILPIIYLKPYITRRLRGFVYMNARRVSDFKFQRFFFKVV